MASGCGLEKSRRYQERMYFTPQLVVGAESDHILGLRISVRAKARDKATVFEYGLPRSPDDVRIGQMFDYMSGEEALRLAGQSRQGIDHFASELLSRESGPGQADLVRVNVKPSLLHLPTPISPGSAEIDDHVATRESLGPNEFDIGKEVLFSIPKSCFQKAF